MIRVSHLAIGLLDLGDQLLRLRNVGGRRAAIVRSVEHAIHGIAAQLDIFGNATPSQPKRGSVMFIWVNCFATSAPSV